MMTSRTSVGNLVLFTLIAAGPLVAQDSTRSAVHVGGVELFTQNQFCFALPRGLIDWRQVAVDALGEARVKNPAPDSLRRYFVEGPNTSIVHYYAPLFPILRREQWLLLHDTGFVAFSPERLHGTLDYRVDEETFAAHGAPSASGMACARTRSDAIHPRFVLEGEVPGAWRSSPGPKPRLLRRNGQTASFSVSIDGRDHRFEYDLTEVQSTRLFRRQGLTFFLVVWSPGDRNSNCSDFSFLYEVTRASKLMLRASSASGCDI